MGSRRLKRRLSLAVLLVASSWGAPLWAQSEDDLARARQMYGQGLTQEAAGDWAGALSAFQSVARIKMTPQVRFHIARCKENLGRLNEALGGYRLAEYEAGQAGDKDELLIEIQKAREALEKRVPKLVIERGEGAEAIKIELDGVVLGQSQIGREVNVDPGPHVVAGVLPGGKRFERTVEVTEGKSETLRLDVPEGLTASEPAPNPGAGSKPTETATTSPKPETGGSSALPWVIGGVGVASLAASGVFYLMKNNAEDELDKGCLGRVCPDTLSSTQDKGKTYATLTGVTLGVGVVGVGVATVMLLSSGSSSPPERAPEVSLGIGPKSVTLGGRF